ncbi:Hemin transport system permease protein HmuU [Pigmentiphaga humi]|uniref:Hemin transport system permease protein HmuU n=1 Tax=Pigmentiphaga humi TaxID=2478468 RepID=A0A3P4B8J1_9BURK|nr:iron ABC transporter permease [Pigmentiphaga humi]VCU72594.1 Hemin transport system permease protein HmuU [Pigmentiphaga humi]
MASGAAGTDADASPSSSWARIRAGRMPGGLLFPILACTLAALVVLAAGRGAYPIPASNVVAILLHKAGFAVGGFEPQQMGVLWSIRLPRVLLGVAVGALLGMAGATLQGLFRNPLADPGLIGVSSGAALTVALTIVFGNLWWPEVARALGMALLPVAAFSGGVLTTLLVYRIGRTSMGVSVAAMLLAGIAMNAIALALIGLASYVATDEQLRNLTFWNLGSLAPASWPVVGMVAFVGAAALAGMWRLRTGLNAMALGESEARHLGVAVERLKSMAIVFSALAVGMAVAFCGIISFLGLVAPHCIRLIAGPDARVVLPGAALLGAALTVGADLVARVIIAPAEMPIGVLTALIGAPFFLVLLLRAKSRMFEA